MQGQEGRLAPSRESNQEIVPAGEQNGNAHVDKAKGTGSVADILAHLKLWGKKPSIGLKVAERDARENYVQNDVDGDEYAKGSAGYVSRVAGESFEASRAEQGG